MLEPRVHFKTPPCYSDPPNLHDPHRTDTTPLGPRPARTRAHLARTRGRRARHHNRRERGTAARTGTGTARRAPAAAARVPEAPHHRRRLTGLATVRSPARV